MFRRGPSWGAWVLCTISVWSLAPTLAHAQTVSPPTAAGARTYALTVSDGRRLDADSDGAWLGFTAPDAVSGAATSAGFSLEPVDPADSELSDGDLIRLRSADGRFIARFGFIPYLSTQPRLAVKWQVERLAGAGALTVGDPFQLRARHSQLYLSARRAQPSLSYWPDDTQPWTLGCNFDRGPFTEPWRTEPNFEVAHGEFASHVAEAVDWLRANTYDVDVPTGRAPLVIWDDPTLAPEPTVAYLMIDTLWAAKALLPYDPELSARMDAGLLALGWYGNGLADTLFRPYPEPAHRPLSADFVHGTLLDRCAFSAADGGIRTAQLRVPEQGVDPAWTTGNSSQFVDSAIYTAINRHWNGGTGAAQEWIQDVITRSGPEDMMFWDSERRVLVDQASRCDYDAFVGECSPNCPNCTPCRENCVYYNASFKLGLILYAARATSVDTTAASSPALEQMRQRMWEGQNDDGGVPHVMFYAADGSYLLSSGATGEATAIAILASSILPPIAF